MAKIPKKCLWRTYDVYNAGTEPTVVNPYAIKVMSEIGIDISKHRFPLLK
jgi:protein-tyrosine-phosphatase